MKVQKLSSGTEHGRGEVGPNKMDSMPVLRLLLGMPVPMVLSMMVQALYNVAASLFPASPIRPRSSMREIWRSTLLPLLSRSRAWAIYLVMLAFGLLGTRAYLESQTSDPVVLEIQLFLSQHHYDLFIWDHRLYVL